MNNNNLLLVVGMKTLSVSFTQALRCHPDTIQINLTTKNYNLQSMESGGLVL